MPRLTLLGHPVHPQLIPIPAALLPTSLLLDLAHHVTGRRSYADAAYLDEALTEPLLRLEEALVPAREGLADSALRPAAA